jgi:hypothetical protein
MFFSSRLVERYCGLNNMRRSCDDAMIGRLWATKKNPGVLAADWIRGGDDNIKHIVTGIGVVMCRHFAPSANISEGVHQEDNTCTC